MWTLVVPMAQTGLRPVAFLLRRKGEPKGSQV